MRIDGMQRAYQVDKQALKNGPPSSSSAHLEPWPGVSYADDTSRAAHPKTGWDVVYRFAQVGVREPVVDWGSTCGNLVAAVAQVNLSIL